MYDYLIVGSGIFGSTLAYCLNKAGKKVLLIDKRDHIGGNIYTKNIDGINVHVYGAHIFHTSNEEIWEFVNKFASFNNFINSPIANYHNELYNLPFNMYTFTQIWKDVKNSDDAKKKIEDEIKLYGVKNPSNLEEQAISLVGKTIYLKLIKEYTEKQWGKKCEELPPEIIKRIPVRYTFDNNYFNDKYQGIPIGGYTKMIENMLKGIEIELNIDYLKHKDELNNLANKIIYTGSIDSYYSYCLGHLEYRSLSFEHIKEDKEYHQQVAVMNYTSFDYPFTRIIEHKYFENTKCPTTIISKEYPKSWNIGDEAYYPINDEKNNNLYNQYLNLAKNDDKVIFGGRLGLYKYFDMDDAIESALALAKTLIN